MKALVLAAGIGTRIGRTAGDLPKPLLKLRETPVIVHNLRLLKSHGLADVWINLHHQAQRIEREIGGGKRWGLRVRYSREEELLGTAGALKKLEDEFRDETFLVLYGDNFTDCDLTSLMKEHKKSKAAGTIAVFDPKKNPNSGIAGGRVLLKKDGAIENFREGPSTPRRTSGGFAQDEPDLVNAGIYALEPQVLEHIPRGHSDFGRDIFPAILGEGLKLNAFKMKGYCLGLDTPESYNRAKEIAARL
jgi:NDP-sugar pyrophosphorylase family protein